MAKDGTNRGNKGHSTKAKGATDKRTNPNKQLLEKYIAEGFDYTKLKSLLDKLYSDGKAGDVKSSSLFLSYMLGKPKETKDIKVELDKNFPEWLDE